MTFFEPIAVVGFGCRVPGARNAQEFFANNQSGTCSLSELPPELRTWHDPLRPKPGFIYTQIGGFFPPVRPSELTALYELHPYAFAGLTPAQLAMLAVAAEAIQSAGWSRTAPEIRKLRVIASNPYMESPAYTRCLKAEWKAHLATRYGIPTLADEPLPPLPNREEAFYQRVTGNTVVLNRFLGLHKAPVFVDGACASGLTAISLAMEWLRQGRDDLVLAGAFCESREFEFQFLCSGAASGTSRSVPFDKRADGVIPGSGGALFLLMRLSDAERLGKPIYGLLRHYGMSNNSSGHVWSSNREAEALAISRCLDALDCSSDEIDYVEAHGTSTPLGDDEEFHALSMTYGKHRTRPLRVASVKSMIGHSLPGAGAVSLLRILYGFRSQTYPRTVNILEPRYGDTPWFHHQTTSEPWTVDGDRPRRAGVDSFGFGGINYHLVVEEYRPASSHHMLPQNHREAPSPLVVVAYHADLPTGASLETPLPTGTYPHLSLPFRSAEGAVYPELKLTHGPADYKIPPRQLANFTVPKALKILDTFLTFKEAHPSLFKNPDRLGILGLCEFESFADLSAANHLKREISLRPMALETKQAVLAELSQCGFSEVIPSASELSSCISRMALLTGISAFAHKLNGPASAGASAFEVAHAYITAGHVDTVIIAGVEIQDYLSTLYHETCVKPQNPETPLVHSAVMVAVKNKAKALQDGDTILAELVSQETRFDTEQDPANAPRPPTAPHFGEAGVNAHLLELGFYLKSGEQSFAIETQDAGMIGRSTFENRSADAKSPSHDGSIETLTLDIGEFAYLRQKDHNRSPDEVARRARSLSDKALHKQHIFRRSEPNGRGKLCVLFPGGGAQFLGCMAGLDTRIPALANFIRRTDSYLRELHYPPVADILWNPQHESRLSRDIEYMQLGITIGNLAYFEVLTQTLGVKPDMLLGHSFGEFAALAAAGIVSEKEALALSAERGVCLKPNDGGLIYVNASADDPLLSAMLDTERELVVIANVNSQNQVILSGTDAALSRWQKALEGKGLSCGRLDIPTPNHTGLNWRASQRFYKRMESLGIAPKPATIPVFSNVLSDFYPTPISKNVFYSLLSHHMAVGVSFARIAKRAYEAGARVFIECGGKNAFTKLVSENLGDRVVSMHTSHPREDPYMSLLRANAFLYAERKTEILLKGPAVFKAYVPKLEPLPSPLPFPTLTREPISLYSFHSDSVSEALGRSVPIAASGSEGKTAVLLAGLDAHLSPDHLVTRYEEIYANAIGPFIETLQEAARSLERDRDRRLLVVANILSTHTAQCDLQKLPYTALIGAVRSLANEYPHSDIRILNLGAGDSPEYIAKTIQQELAMPRTDPCIFWKDGRRHAVSLEAM